jgi:hypothetical protein
MALEPEDTYRLNVWSFLTDFQKLKTKFIELARIAYHATKDLNGRNPSADECEKLFSGILLKSEIFRGILNRKYLLLPDFYQSYALAFARYVLHNHWPEVSL